MLENSQGAEGCWTTSGGRESEHLRDDPALTDRDDWLSSKQNLS